VVVDRDSHTLTLWKVHGGLYKVVREYRVAVGADGHETPTGLYFVEVKSKNPKWKVPDADWVQPPELRGQVLDYDNPRNPFYYAFISFSSKDGVGIHGTKFPPQVGKDVSHGCVRMTAYGIRDLYDRLPPGSPVFIYGGSREKALQLRALQSKLGLQEEEDMGDSMAEQERPRDLAWDKEYWLHDPIRYEPKGSPAGYGCIAIKRELKYNGYDATGFGTDSPVIGAVADRLIRKFQQDKGLFVDGRVGPVTAKELFRRRVVEAQTDQNIPNDLVGKLLDLESSWDPGATNGPYADGSLDRGLAEINSVQRPDVTEEEAFDPAFSIPYAARGLRNAYNTLGEWDGAVGAHNVGTGGARTYMRARDYVALVEGRAF